MILLNKHWRIIESRENPPYRQWLLQKWQSKNGWVSESWCQTRSGLLAAIKSKVDSVEPAALDAVSRLPERVYSAV